MSILSVGYLSYGLGDRTIFHDVSFYLLKGEHIGLIGANGEGKSTFMNVITDELMSDEGKVEWAKNVHVGYLDQHATLEKGMTVRDMLKSVFAFPLKMEEQINYIYDSMGDAGEEEIDAIMEELGTIRNLLVAHDFYTIDSKVKEVGCALDLDDIGMDKGVTELFGGQRTKVLLGKLLLQKPDILLLDEPTNYLDVVYVKWLKHYFQEYGNAFILISHDTSFPNSAINLTCHVENQSLNRYVGDYDKFQEVYVVKKAQLGAAYKRQQQKIPELEDFVARNKARVTVRNTAISRQRKLDKMNTIELTKEKPRPELHSLNAHTADKYISETTDLIIDCDKLLSRPLNLVIERGQRVVLVGANGVGKAALLKSILGVTPALSRSVELSDHLSIGYFEQEVAFGSTSTCLKEIWKGSPSHTQYQVRSALTKCGPTAKRIESQVRVLSGEEQVKARLCKLVNRESNVLLLDEPTDHPDVDVKEELKRILKEYRGSILLICHKPEFHEGLTTDVWDCKEWALRLSWPAAMT